MTSRVLVLSIVAGLGLGGCAAAPERQMPPPAALVTSCNSAGGSPCKIAVTASIQGGACVASAPDVDLSGRTTVRLVWQLPNGFLFCPTLGDGAYIKTVDDDEQFGDFKATNKDNGDDDDAGTTDKCRKRFRIVDKYSTSATAYPYLLRFHDKTGKISCTVDPYVRNG